MKLVVTKQYCKPFFFEDKEKSTLEVNSQKIDTDYSPLVFLMISSEIFLGTSS